MHAVHYAGFHPRRRPARGHYPVPSVAGDNTCNRGEPLLTKSDGGSSMAGAASATVLLGLLYSGSLDPANLAMLMLKPVHHEAVGLWQVDGIRLVSNSASELLRGVPDALADVYRVGSTAPGVAGTPTHGTKQTCWHLYVRSHSMEKRRCD